jgi:glycosyltransferase involved in cell wall biosynthesis
MPKISLVVCLYKERDLLERLLQHAEGCYDDLVVVHDGPETGDPSWRPGPPAPELAIDWATIPPNAPLPDFFAKCQTPSKPGSIRELVESRGGRFFAHPRVGSLEGQSPFAWWAAKHDWILRLDADEFPSEKLKVWLKEFRSAEEPEESISGFTCVWPLWDGKKALGSSWPDGRIFLFNRRAIRFFGLVEQVPIPEGKWINLDLVLHHEPKRKSFGFRNILFRRQCWVWRRVIARCLVESSVSKLPRWNYGDSNWPRPFLDMAEHPLLHMYRSMFISWRWSLKHIIKSRLWSVLYCFYASGWHHALICLEVLRIRYLCRSKSQRSS